MKSFKVARTVLKKSQPWEWAYIGTLVTLVLVAMFHAALRLPLLVASFLVVPIIGMFMGLFFVLDIMRSRGG